MFIFIFDPTVQTFFLCISSYPIWKSPSYFAIILIVIANEKKSTPYFLFQYTLPSSLMSKTLTNEQFRVAGLCWNQLSYLQKLLNHHFRPLSSLWIQWNLSIRGCSCWNLSISPFGHRNLLFFIQKSPSQQDQFHSSSLDRLLFSLTSYRSLSKWHRHWIHSPPPITLPTIWIYSCDYTRVYLHNRDIFHYSFLRHISRLQFLKSSESWPTPILIQYNINLSYFHNALIPIW